MQAFKELTGIVAPLDRANIDTDAIIPKQFLKSIKRTGFGPNLFDEWRYLDHGEPGMDNSKRKINPDFVLNKTRYQGAKILLTRDNFGCGSSREHAPWALEDFGIRAIIAPSFADIFYNNCLKNGVLPVVLASSAVERLFHEVAAMDHYQLTVALESQQVILPSGERFDFAIDAFQKHCLWNGLDDIALTLQYSDDIKAYEARQQRQVPWLY